MFYKLLYFFFFKCAQSAFYIQMADKNANFNNYFCSKQSVSYTF